MPLSPVDIRVWEWIEYHLSHLFWPLVKLVAFCSSTRMSPPRHPSTFRKFKLLCNECSFMRTWWSFFARSLMSRTELVAPLSCARISPPIYQHDLSENSEQWWMLWRVTQNCHLQPVTTISLSPEHLCPALSPWPCRCGVGHSNAR